MNRQEFMAQLERLLWDIPENDRIDAIDYYNNYFDEAGAENEAKVIQELGSPGKVAAIIKADLASMGNEKAEYTENGYYDGRGEANENSLSRRETGYQEPKSKRKIPLALIIILLVFASPVLLGLAGGLLGGLVGVLGALIGILAAIVAGGVGCLIGGIVSIVYGIIQLVISPLYALLYIGMGALVLSVGILFVVLLLWCVLRWLPALFRVCVNLVQRLLHREGRGSQI